MAFPGSFADPSLGPGGPGPLGPGYATPGLPGPGLPGPGLPGLGPGLPGLGPGLPGLGPGLPGLGLGLPGLGLGLPGLGLGLGGPGFAPYVPVTPLGALEAFKGDLIVPIIVIGVILFILIIIILAIKSALLWKAGLISEIADPRRGRSIPEIPKAQAHDPEQMANLATIVMSALDNQRCLEKIVCSVGTYGQGSSWPSWVSMMENLVSEDYRHSLTVMKSCAEGNAKVEDFSCGGRDGGSRKDQKQSSSDSRPHQNQTKPELAGNDFNSTQGSSFSKLNHTFAWNGSNHL